MNDFAACPAAAHNLADLNHNRAKDSGLRQELLQMR
jgi:hypothetical protein